MSRDIPGGFYTSAVSSTEVKGTSKSRAGRGADLGIDLNRLALLSPPRRSWWEMPCKEDGAKVPQQKGLKKKASAKYSVDELGSKYCTAQPETELRNRLRRGNQQDITLASVSTDMPGFSLTAVTCGPPHHHVAL